MKFLLPVHTVWVDASEGAEGYEVRWPGDGCTLQDSILDRSLRLGVSMEMVRETKVMTALTGPGAEVEVVWVEVRQGNTLRRELVDPRYSLRLLMRCNDSMVRHSPEGRRAINAAAGCVVELQEEFAQVRHGPSQGSVFNACWALLRPKIVSGARLVHEGPRALEV